MRQNKDIKIEEPNSIKKIFGGKGRVGYMAILEIDENNMEKIVKAGSLNIKWRTCKVYKYVNVFRCFKCFGFNHKGSECKNEANCDKCGNTKHQGHCKEEIKCGNCVNANKSLNMDLEVNHSVFSRECAVYLQQVKRVEDRITLKDDKK